MSLETPDKIRTLQRKLYLKAKAEPSFRFYLLYDKIYRADILRHAYDLVRANKGAPGVDGVSCAAIEATGPEKGVSKTWGYAASWIVCCPKRLSRTAALT
jgi:RNA-directed DNA polymerase